MIHYSLINITPVTLARHSTGYRFTLREEKPDGSVVIIHGCLAGRSSRGDWAWAPKTANGHSVVEWNTKQEAIILEALKKSRLLDQLESPPATGASIFADIHWEDEEHAN